VTDAAEVRLQEGYRVIRQMVGEADSPWPGVLVCAPTGEIVVAVDSDLLGDRWWGWAADPKGHVLAPVDILRRTSGHDVLLPVCTERLAEFLDRRGGSDLTAGEAVTVAVSLLRGLGELQTGADDACGVWWLTEAGRPVVATDTSDGSILEHTIDLLRRIALDVPALADAVTDVVEAMADSRRGRVLERAEAEIFAVAEPTALATTTFGPKRVRGRSPLQDDTVIGDSEPPRRSWPIALSRHLDAEWADVLSRTTTGVWRALRTPRAGRRRPWLVAGGLACAIVAGGLLWPTGDGGPATARTSQPATDPAVAPSSSAIPASPGDTASAAASGSEPVEAPHGSDQPADLTSLTAALLSARTACAGQSTCLDGVLETEDARYPPGVVDVPEEGRSLTLLDDFGGAAVLRVEPISGEGAPQLVVIVQVDGRWLLRDVYDIAEQ
jgi:hypothetical protein